MRVQEMSLEKQRLRTFSSCLPAREDLTHTHTHTHTHPPKGFTVSWSRKKREGRERQGSHSQLQCTSKDPGGKFMLKLSATSSP